MSLVVTGATGSYGRLVVESLLERGAPADAIVAGGRRVEQLDDLAERGVRVARMDFDDPESLSKAFAGAERVLVVSGSEFGRRVSQHRAAIEAAVAAGARLVAYTSAPYADTTGMRLAADHRETENILRAAGVPVTLLRNSWYFENYTVQIPRYLAGGEVVGSAGTGRISGAARADYAEAGAVVLLGEGHENATYELGGDESFTLGELAAEVARQSGKPVAYRDLELPEHVAALVAAGLPEPAAELFADVDQSIRQGALLVQTGDLHRLLGRPTTRLADAVAQALRALG